MPEPSPPSFGLADIIAEIVATAMDDLADLPPETEEELIEFGVSTVNGLFWERIIERFPAKARQSLVKAAESPEALQAWQEEHVSMMETPEMLERAEQILKDIAENLPRMLREHLASLAPRHHG